MSARIIIEKDGRRWSADDYDIHLTTYSSTASLKGIGVWATDVYLTEMPPVEHTDNSEVIARMEAENAELKRKVGLALELTGWIGMNAENELWQTIRDRACAVEFSMNHPEVGGEE